VEESLEFGVPKGKHVSMILATVAILNAAERTARESAELNKK
jgi:hypothetical protein